MPASRRARTPSRRVPPATTPPSPSGLCLASLNTLRAWGPPTDGMPVFQCNCVSFLQSLSQQRAEKPEEAGGEEGGGEHDLRSQLLRVFAETQRWMFDSTQTGSGLVTSDWRGCLESFIHPCSVSPHWSGLSPPPSPSSSRLLFLSLYLFFFPSSSFLTPTPLHFKPLFPDEPVTSPTTDRSSVAKKRFTLQGFSNLKSPKGNISRPEEVLALEIWKLNEPIFFLRMKK